MNALPNLTELDQAQKDTLIIELYDQVCELSAKLKELTDRQSKNSRNSGKPPSSDGYNKENKEPKPPRTSSERTSSGKNVGGQRGHKGTTLQMVDNPDCQEIHLPTGNCDQCSRSLDGLHPTLTPQRRQVFDLPKVRFDVTEHRVATVECTCGKIHHGTFPDYVQYPVQYGPRSRGLAGYLANYQLMPYDRMKDFFADAYGQNISVGTLSKMSERGTEILFPIVDDVANAIAEAEVAGFDESGMRISGKLKWLHSASTVTLTWYGIHDKRGQEAMDDHGILPNFDGVAVHDGFKSYRHYSCLHALCNAHHLRELTFIAETTGQIWPTEMKALLLDMKWSANTAYQNGYSSVPSNIIDMLTIEYDRLIKNGLEQNPRASNSLGKRGRTKQSDAYNLLDRLRSYKEDTLRFLNNLSVPFDNNASEQTIRMPKAKMKISGCFRTDEGAKEFCAYRSYIATMRKQGQNLLDSLCSLFIGEPILPIFA